MTIGWSFAAGLMSGVVIGILATIVFAAITWKR